MSPCSAFARQVVAVRDREQEESMIEIMKKELEELKKEMEWLQRQHKSYVMATHYMLDEEMILKIWEKHEEFMCKEGPTTC
jgi:hypothetical protein